MYGESKPAGNAPTMYRTNNTFATTFSGPIKKNERLFDTSRNQSMAQAAFQGDTRQYEGQQNKGVQAGGKMAA